MRLRWTYCLGGVGLLALTAAALLAPLSRARDHVQPDRGTTNQAAAPRAVSGARDPLRVSAVRVEPASLAETVTAIGSLRAAEAVQLQAETSGRIVSIHFEEGQRVSAGDLLVKLNDADLRAALDRARHRRQLAVERERRVLSLFEAGISNQEEYDTATSELGVQRAEVALIEAQIAQTEIRAPFDGVVGLRFVSEGAFINASSRIATLQRLDELKLDFSLPERFAPRINPGLEVRFSVAGFDESFHATVYAHEPGIDAATRTLLVRARAANPGARLLPGAFARVEVTLDRLEGAILLPSVAVVPDVDGPNVFVVRDGRAERRPVHTGTRTERTIHVLSGVGAGDVVITSGLQQVREGSRVDVVLEGGRAEAPPDGQDHGAGAGRAGLASVRLSAVP